MTRFGIVGTGRISDWVLKGALQDSRFKVTAVCSRTEENARAFIAKHPEAFPDGASVYTDIEALALDSNVDAIYIGTPNSTHCSYTLCCLNHGKAVLCEKPLGCNAEQVERMVEASRRNGVLLMEAMISILNPNFIKARELMAKAGPIRYYYSGFCQYSSKYEALKKGLVASSFNPQMGGGAMADIGIYTTYPMIALFGMPEKCIKAEKVMHKTPYGEVDLQGSAVFSYPGMTACLSYSKICDSHLPTEICGECGNISLDAVHICRRVEFAPHAAPSSGRGELAGHQTVADGLPKDEYYYEFEEFINVIEAGLTESSVNTLDLSLANRRLMDAILSI